MPTASEDLAPPPTGMSGMSQGPDAASRQRGFYSEKLLLGNPAVAQGRAGVARSPQLLPAGGARPASRRSQAPRASTFAVPPVDEDALRRRAALGLGADATSQERAGAPTRALEPKVLVPFNPGKGETPRKITIERQKRLFSLQDIRQLLSDEGIEPDFPDEGSLPLSLFDDTEFESRPPQEWVSLATDPDTGERLFVPAKFLHRDPSTCAAEWRECQVIGFDEHESLFRCRALAPEAATDPATARSEWMEVRVPRVELLFAAEDPFVFAKRVAAAHRARAEADAFLRRELYVDSMPTDGISPLDKERMARMLALSLSNTLLRERRANATALLGEVGSDYG
ncbi:hypothetical protein T492DRAFT_353558 [Pavlovales sp. CCMP2436]|nr:hypothetical protein T492DRAFT_353558 [Pavlovales sp. CCMP2436]